MNVKSRVDALEVANAAAGDDSIVLLWPGDAPGTAILPDGRQVNESEVEAIYPGHQNIKLTWGDPDREVDGGALDRG